jgi:hypothetical protein
MGVLTAGGFLLAGALALFLVLFTGRSSSSGEFVPRFGEPGEDAAEVAGEGPTSYEAYLSAARTYPAQAIPPAVVARAKATFVRIARRDARLAKRGRRFLDAGHKWKLYGPRQNATEPGVLSFSGATNDTASRVTALVVDPDCSARRCRLWTGVSGGGVWRTDNALAPNPEWKQVSPEDLDQNSVGALTLVPGHGKHDTLYLGTGEANRCSSGCEAGVGIYRSTDGGEHWKKLPDACVSNGVYACVTPGRDSFLGRGIRAIVIDPTNRDHIFVGSALGVRGLSHVIGAPGETQRFEPGANEPGVYESFDGGDTFTEVWNGTKPDPAGPGGTNISFGVTDLELDPLNPAVVYASAFDAGAWRRDAGAAPTAFQQVFAPRMIPPTCTATPANGCGLAGTDRTMFALTVKNGKTRIYLTDGTANGAGIASQTASEFWRTDNGNQPAATLLASEPAGATEPAGNGNPFPATYNTWQRLTSHNTTSPYFAPDDFCWAQCWYDENVYTPAGLPDTVYLLGANQYGEQPCDTKGVGCGNGRSNGREVLYSNTAGDPDSANVNRTFTDLSYDAQDTSAPWCAYAAYFQNGCLRAPNGIHPDQHAIVINPGNPTQIFEGSDGGIIRTSGTFANISSQCSSPFRNGDPVARVAGPIDPADLLACQRLLSRVPVELGRIDRRLGSTLQFINVAINPALSCEVMGGTQDNGTWSNNDGCDRNTFDQVIYGDGGNALYDATNPTWRANEFTSGASDSNFRNGDPEKWVVTAAPVRRSGEGPAFYWPEIGDPNPAPGTHPIYSGAKHIWRTWAFGAGTPTTAGPQSTTPDIATYEANCPEFVTLSTKLGCGDYRPMGGPYCDGIAVTPAPSCIDQPGDLTGTVYGTDRLRGAVSWIARDSADHGTLWAATSAGRIFVTHNADAVDPSTVTWHRIDNATSPTRFPSSIYVDPADTGHAWVTYSGYNAVTPATPGHVFEVHEGNPAVTGSGTFANLNVESGTAAFPTPTATGDLPVSDVVRDDATRTLYVSTDFGVLRGDDDGAGGWHVTAGMPRYEVMHLEIQPSSRVPTCTGKGGCERLLYAATHSQGIWQMHLGGSHGRGH